MEGQLTENLAKLPLNELLEHDLELQELLDLQGVHVKIKTNMKIWIDHLRKNPEVAHRFINMGIKCPMHQSNNPQMKTRTHIASDILTSDHQTLADLLIQPTQRSNEDEIQEEIETEDNTNVGPVSEEQEYVFLISILEYTKGEEHDENCLNYMAKALQTLIRKKISPFLQFFLQKPQYLSRLTELSHFPSISHLLAKMLTDDDDSLTQNAIKVKRMIVPAFLHKLHSEICQARTLELIEGIEDILNASRYSDNQQPTELQKASIPLVSAEEVRFMMNIIFEGLQAQNKTESHLRGVINASTYLGLCLNRMTMDEQQELLLGSVGPQEFKPTLDYHLDELFLGFCKWVSTLHRIWEFKTIANKQFPLLPVKILEPLTLITKHSKFIPLYRQIPLDQRCFALQALLKLTCATDISGILLQGATSLIEKMLTQQQSLAEEGLDIVPPSELFISIENYSNAIAASIALVLQQSRNQRNKNQKGIYFRKSLLLLDNYFKHPKVLEKYPHTPKLEQLFPQFNHRNCQLYAEKAIVLDHPGGTKVQQVEEFKFIAKNLHLIRTIGPESEGPEGIEKEKKEMKEMEAKREREEEKPKEIVFKLDAKMIARKNKVKQQNTDKDIANPKVREQPSTTTPKKEEKEKEPSKQMAVQAKEAETSPVSSPNKGRQQSGLNFFVRHLMIY